MCSSWMGSRIPGVSPRGASDDRQRGARVSARGLALPAHSVRGSRVPAMRFVGVYLARLLMASVFARPAGADWHVVPSRRVIRVPMRETDFLSDLHYSERTILFADVV